MEHGPCSCPISADDPPSCARLLILVGETGLAGEAAHLSGAPPPAPTVMLGTGQALSWERLPCSGPRGWSCCSCWGPDQGLCGPWSPGGHLHSPGDPDGDRCHQGMGAAFPGEGVCSSRVPTGFLCVSEKSGNSLRSPDLPKPGEARGCARGRQTRVEGTLIRAVPLGPHSPCRLGRARGERSSVCGPSQPGCSLGGTRAF